MDFQKISAELIARGMKLKKPMPPHIEFEDAGQLLRQGLRHVVGADYVWLPEYEQVADWLTDNNCKGLTLLGNCGRGKTVIQRQIIPVLLHWKYNYIVSIYDSVEMAKRTDEVLQWKLLQIDDVGVEGETNDYGMRRNAFAELVDAAEKQGKLLLVTSNLSADELRQRYGERTLDRLRSITRCIVFKGASLRDINK